MIRQFFNVDGIEIEKYKNNQGLDGFTRLLKFSQQGKDLWMVYELAGIPISKALYNMKGEFYKGQRLYKINFTNLYYEQFQSGSLYLQSFIKQIALSFNLLQ